MVSLRTLSRPAGARWLIGSALLCVSAGCYRSGGSEPAPAPESVGVGYGTQSSATLTQAVESVSGQELGNVKVGRIEELFQGRLSGVQVIRTPDGGFGVRIRGAGSPSNSGEPLYVIDGVPVRIAPGHGLTWLNPADVARIDVLKGAAAGIYGWTGGNGVVLITTTRR
jgi:TonB-dependent starch-binding outer membrane protein SusC